MYGFARALVYRLHQPRLCLYAGLNVEIEMNNGADAVFPLLR